MPKDKEWEYYKMRLRDMYDYFNEDLDKGVEKLEDVVNRLSEKLDIQVNEVPSELIKQPSLVEMLNNILMQFKKQEISTKQALEALQVLLLRSSKTKVIYLSELPKLQRFNNLKYLAIENKDFEKAALYRDLAMDYKVYKQMQLIASRFNMDAYFAYWVDVLYFVVQTDGEFNQEVIKLL